MFVCFVIFFCAIVLGKNGLLCLDFSEKTEYLWNLSKLQSNSLLQISKKAFFPKQVRWVFKKSFYPSEVLAKTSWRAGNRNSLFKCSQSQLWHKRNTCVTIFCFFGVFKERDSKIDSVSFSWKNNKRKKKICFFPKQIYLLRLNET